MTEPAKEVPAEGGKDEAKTEQKKDQVKLVLDAETGEMVSKSELKSRTKMRAKAKKNEEKQKAKEEKEKNDPKDSKDEKAKEEELDPTVNIRNIIAIS